MPGRVVAVLLREHRRAHHEQIVGVPGLQIAVHHARLRIGAHHRAAGVVGRLVRHDVEVLRPRMHVVVRRVHRLDDGLELGQQEARHLVVVVGEVVGQPQQRPAERILVGRVEVDEVLAVGIDRALRVERAVVVPLRPSPASNPSPSRGVPCGTGRSAIGAAVRAVAGDIAAAEEAQAGVIEVVAVEVVDAHARAGIAA